MTSFQKYSIQYKAFNSRGETVGNGFREEIAHSEERAVQVLKETVRSWTRNADRIETKTLSCEPVGKESEPAPLTPDNCGCSQIACNIVNNTFLSLDGFEAMRKQMAGTDYTAEHFGAELARIVDREMDQVTEFIAFAQDQLIENDCELNGGDFIEACKDRLLIMKRAIDKTDIGIERFLGLR